MYGHRKTGVWPRLCVLCCLPCLPARISGQTSPAGNRTGSWPIMQLYGRGASWCWVNTCPGALPTISAASAFCFPCMSFLNAMWLRLYGIGSCPGPAWRYRHREGPFARRKVARPLSFGLTWSSATDRRPGYWTPSGSVSDRVAGRTASVSRMCTSSMPTAGSGWAGGEMSCLSTLGMRISRISRPSFSVRHCHCPMRRPCVC